MKQHLVYLKREEVNDREWNACVAAAPNGTLYSYTWYLDAVSENWDGLVLNNYEAVMPLPWRKKWGFFYIYTPFLTQQTGVTGSQLTPEKVRLFLDAIPKRFRYADLGLNAGNIFQLPPFEQRLRSNLVLHLNAPYQSIYKNYRPHIKRNIKKAMESGCIIRKNIPVDEVLNLAKNFTPGIKPHQSKLHPIRNLYNSLQTKKCAATYGVYTKEGQLLAAAIFVFSNNRAYYILAGNYPTGKKRGASHLLIDAFIQDYSDQDLILDFEGSDLPGLHFFYSSFGAKDEKYPALKINRLPFFAKWLKR